MLLSGERTMAIYCPACEQVHFHQFSLFELSNSPRAFHCACGFTQAHIAKHNHRYEISLLTAAGDRVRLLFPFREIWSAPLLTLYSPGEGDILASSACRSGGRSVADLDSDFGTGGFLRAGSDDQDLAYLQKLASNHRSAVHAVIRRWASMSTPTRSNLCVPTAAAPF